MEDRYAKTKSMRNNKIELLSELLFIDYKNTVVGGERVTDFDNLESSVLYEVKWRQCEMSLSIQGQNDKSLSDS